MRRPEDDGFLLDSKDNRDKIEDGPVLPTNETVQQWRLHSPVDELREALLGFDALHQRRDLRLEVLRNLSNPWPPAPSGPQERERQLQLPEANAAPIPHLAFKQRLQVALGHKEIRKVLRTQLLRCEWPSEILRIMAVAMQHRNTARNFVVIAEPIIRALYRCRKNVSDPEILKVLNVILWRFKLAKLSFDPILIHMGLKFAARSRSLTAMKKYLRMLRESGQGMTSNTFRSIIAKFSIGHRGLGEIRNGRWKREQLLQVLKGFDDAADLPLEQQYHLGTFLIREDWQYLHGWIAVLSRCKASEEIWREWELWKKSPARLQPKMLKSQRMTSKVRGDYWFCEQMAMAGDYKRAWQIIAETDLPFTTIKDRVKMKLVEGIQYATFWNDDVRAALIQKYDADLAKIEKAFGVQWKPTGDGEGIHELVQEQETTLEKLGAEDWKADEDEFGFPYHDDEAIVPESEERALHHAEERGLAETEADH